jgi:uncharacterized protein (DUF302 family)
MYKVIRRLARAANACSTPFGTASLICIPCIEEQPIMATLTPGIIELRSPRSVARTIDQLQELVKARGLTVFARIDFSGDAERAGLVLRPMQLLIFGDPKAGTPLLLSAPRIGLDLPLKALAWESEDGAVWLSWKAPEELETRYALPHELTQNIAGIRALGEAAVAP